MGNPMTIVGGRIVRKWQHEEPKAAIVAWCPHCLTYGGPMGIEDRVCGNCNQDGCRMYQEVIREQFQCECCKTLFRLEFMHSKPEGYYCHHCYDEEV